jgi:hypothetical protein
MILKDESLIGSVVIGVEFGRDDHGLIPVIAIGRGLEPLDALQENTVFATKSLPQSEFLVNFN